MNYNNYLQVILLISVTQILKLLSTESDQCYESINFPGRSFHKFTYCVLIIIHFTLSGQIGGGLVSR